MVNVALPDRPDFMSGSDAVVMLRDGRAVSVSVRTHGSNGQTGDFRALKDATATPARAIWRSPGTPVTVSRCRPRASLRADWTLSGDTTVYFNSGEFGVYLGLVRLQTSAAPAHQPGVWD